jgi:hypothetical protein
MEGADTGDEVFESMQNALAPPAAAANPVLTEPAGLRMSRA